MSDLSYPRRVPGYHGDSRCSAAQVDFLLGFMPNTGSLLEVGSASGTTAAVVADARPAGRVVCVDTYPGLETYAEVMLRLIDWRRNQRPNMTLWLGGLNDLSAWLHPSKFFEVAFIDADHTFDCTRFCLGHACRVVAPRGRIVVHDWKDPAWPEVETAVKDWMAESGWGLVAEDDFICALGDPR